MAIDTLTLVLLFIIGLCILVIIAWLTIALWRRWRAKVMIVENVSNPGVPAQKYYAIYDKRRDYIMLYKNLFQPFKTKVIPPFNSASFLWEGRIYAYVGVGLNPEDVNIVPLHKPLVSRANAIQFAQEMSGAVLSTLDFINATMKYNIGDQVSFPVATASVGGLVKGERTIAGTITSLGFNGVGISYYVKDKDGNDKVDTINLYSLDSISQLKVDKTDKKDRRGVTLTGEQPKKATLEDRIAQFFTDDWVMQNLGIVPVEDVNVVLENEKASVASFNSKINERVRSHEGWFTRNRDAIVLAMLIIATAVAQAIIAWYVWNFIGHIPIPGAGATVPPSTLPTTSG